MIRESIVRSHARAVENMILVGNSADGAFGTGGAAPDGLVTLAAADSDKTQSGTAFASGAFRLTFAFEMRTGVRASSTGKRIRLLQTFHFCYYYSTPLKVSLIFSETLSSNA